MVRAGRSRCCGFRGSEAKAFQAASSVCENIRRAPFVDPSRILEHGKNLVQLRRSAGDMLSCTVDALDPRTSAASRESPPLTEFRILTSVSDSFVMHAVSRDSFAKDVPRVALARASGACLDAGRGRGRYSLAVKHGVRGRAAGLLVISIARPVCLLPHCYGGTRRWLPSRFQDCRPCRRTRRPARSSSGPAASLATCPRETTRIRTCGRSSCRRGCGAVPGGLSPPQVHRPCSRR